VAKHEPEVRLANGKAYAETCNDLVHRAPWTTGRTKDPGAGGFYQALELAQIAYEAHGLPYEHGLSKMKDYDPRRFRWLCDECGEADVCVKVLDTKTGRLAVWPYWPGLSAPEG